MSVTQCRNIIAIIDDRVSKLEAFQVTNKKEEGILGSKCTVTEYSQQCQQLLTLVDTAGSSL